MQELNILIVDDEKNVRELLSKHLLKMNHRPVSAENGKAGLKIIDTNHIDVLISDIRMPDMNGLELLKEVHIKDPSISIIMMTAYATVETAVEAMKLGASDYIMKPFDLNEINESIMKISQNVGEHSDQDNNKTLTETFLTSKSKHMQKAIDLIQHVADTNSTVILYGETGTGKELAAQALHTLSGRSKNPFIKVNCAALPETLLESELFGYEKGAFTGASIKKPGRFELADSGSLFLDEIGDITPVIQVKLLRVLQEREFERLGGISSIRVNVRLITATNRNLEEMVRKNTFREDLFYRLNVVPIHLPALRERREDIPYLVDFFLKKSAFISGRTGKIFSKEAIQKLSQWDWPGNIRELENIIERCVVITTENTIDTKHLPEYINHPISDPLHWQESNKLDTTVDFAEKNAIIKTLHDFGGNRTKASIALGISRRSLHRKILKYNIEE